jgi:DNA-binding XRE family transcriptional regulator
VPRGPRRRGLDMKTVKKVDFPAQLQMSSAKELGIAVRSARTVAGFTLASAAQALGISKQTLSDLELGTGTVTLALAFQALNALGVSVFVVPAQDNSRVRRALKGAGLGT